MCLLFPLSQPFQPQLSLLNTVICHCPTCLVYCKTFLHDLSSKAEFPQRREECRIKDGILVITAIEFLADLRQDLKCSLPPQLVGWCRKSKGLSLLSDSLPEAIALRSRAMWASGPELLLYFILFF